MPLTEGGSDRIEHTLRHFLEPGEQWERVAPVATLAPAKVREQIAASGWSHQGFSRYDRAVDRRINDLRWWSEPRRGVVEHAHDLGYWPRYFGLVARSGAVGSAGARWIRSKERLVSDVDGFRVVVAPRNGKRLQVLTAFRSAVLVSRSGPTEMVSMKDALRAWCQKRGAGSSSGGAPHE